MKITYAPEGAVAQVWDFDLNSLMMGELKAIKKYTGLEGLVDLGEGLNRGDPDALCALVWVLRKRNEDPTLRYVDVDFAIGDVSFEGEEQQADDEDDEDGSVLPK